ncbi:Sas10/Utp3/C1D-like protein [Elsinoe fawcettii]|nr:Sas10/Utp3/C1D-like protein [Elsinoe fawcettii]
MSPDGDSMHVASLLSNLSAHVDTTATTLQPLLARPLSSTAGKLPLLDKAKLYIHVAYAIESLLFSQLQLSGVDAKAHPIFSELKRVRSYFEKIKHAEGQGGPNMRLAKDAAGRMIKAGLAGNDRKDREDAAKGTKRKVQEDELVERYSKGNRFGAARKRMKEAEAEGREERVGGASVEQADGGQEAAHEGDTGTKKSRRSDKGDKHGKKKKLSHAPQDAHQAYQKLLAKSKDSSDSNEGSGKKKKRKA